MMNEKQLRNTWNARNEKHGVSIGNDLLFKGCNIDNIDTLISRSEIEIETECDFDDDNYYLIINANHGNYGAIELIEDIADLALKYFYN